MRVVETNGLDFEASGQLELPTVDAVRRLSKTNMNNAS
jgi:hypothetical protein